MKVRSLILLTLFSIVKASFGGFVAGTLIRTPDGYVPIEQLREGDAVVSILPDQSERVVEVIQKYSYLSDFVYQVVIDGESLCCDVHQKLYEPVAQEWIEAKDLLSENILFDSAGRHLPILFSTKLSEKKTVYELSVEPPHTFLVGQSEILAHNFGIVAGISFAFGAGGLSLEGISIAIGGIGVALYNFFKGKRKVRVKPHVETFRTPSPVPTPDPDDEKKKEKKKDDKGGGGTFEFSADDLEHMFDTREGHFPDIPVNRKLIRDLTSDPDLYLGTDIHGKIWYGKIVQGGKQLWAYIRNNVIKNCGLNDVPREFNPETGLCRRFPPKFKR